MGKPREPWTYSDREGYVTDDGKIRIYGFSAAPEEPLTPVANMAAEPVTLRLEPGRYSWCTCGQSQNQPFCDNAHRDAPTNRKSYKFEILEATDVRFCLCKRTSNPPFCDGTHCGNDTPGAAGDDDA
jgi:CDGSH-type Zn-finger protein